MMVKASPPGMPTTKQPGHDHPVCPSCGTELCGGKLLDWGREHQPDNPEEYAEAYGWPEHLCGSKVIGIETDAYDGVSFWRYPCCGSVYDRFTGERLEGGE